MGWIERPSRERNPAASATIRAWPHSCAVCRALRQAQDTHVEKLYDFAPALGAAWVEARDS